MMQALLSVELLEILREPAGLLVQTPQWKIRKGKYCGTPVCVRSLRATATKRQLSAAAYETLDERVTPFVHPNLDQPLGLVPPRLAPDSERSGAPAVDHVVTAYYATSLFEVLHRDCIALSPHDIAFVSAQVLRALSFLHQHDETLGVCLTSRRVMLDAVGSVKLRRFGSELIARQRASSSSSCSVASLSATRMYQTVYELLTCGGNTADGGGLTSKAQDLFAFGVLLLEMCTGEKPTSELVNKVSRSRQFDPVFYAIIRSALRLGGIDGLSPPLELDGDCPEHFFLDGSSHLVTAASLLELLVRRYPTAGNSSSTANEGIGTQTRSSVAFPSFLHVDRYFAAKEQERVDAALTERSSHAEIMVKRLEAVEQELVDEQRNFEVLVQQFEHLQREKTAVDGANEKLQALVKTLQAKLMEDVERIATLTMVSEERATRLVLAHECFTERQTRILKIDGEKRQVMSENQQLLVEILQLKDDKARVLELKRGVELEREELQKQVGSEWETLEDLQGRLQQAIHRWQDEQIARRRAEYLAETASQQLLQLEDERCRYSLALWQSPTGERNAKETPALVIALKDREAQRLADELDAAHSVLKEQEVRIQKLRDEKRAVEDERQSLVDRLGNLQEEAHALESVISASDTERRTLRRETELTRAEIAVLKQQIARLEQQLEQQSAAAKAAENARRLRQCLTPNCDAPKYLVGPSGYCKECEKRTRRSSAASGLAKHRHRRQRSLDSASSPGFTPHAFISGSAKNVEVVRLVRGMEEPPRGEEYLSLTEVEASERDMRQRLGCLKQLTALLISNDTLKDDLPECEAIKAVLALMHEYRASPGFQLEACKFLSVSVFNHDRTRIIVAAEGAIELVLSAVKRFLSDLKLQEACCVALTNLAHNCETNRKRILASGGVDAVLRLMQTQPKSPGVQKRCCWALLTLAGSDEMCEGVAARGGVGAVLAAMLNCPASDEVQYYGSWALLNLVSGTSTLQQFARREGVVEVVEAARACFPDHDGIQEKTRDILDVLAC